MAFDVDTGTVARPDAEPASVLVVSTDRALADAVTLVLEEWGFATVVAADAGQALDLCRNSRPNLVLLDLTARAKAMEGLAQNLARELAHHAPPLVALHSDDDVVQRMSGPAVSFLRAPFHLDDLQDVIAEHCLPPSFLLH